MADYQEMYLHLMRQTEQAVRILIAAQRDCEELYLRDGGPQPAPAEEKAPLPGEVRGPEDS